MRILIVVPSQDRISGNWITASRFQHGLERQGHQVVLQDSPLRPQKALRRCLVDFAPDVVLLLHAYRSGSPWLKVAGGLNIPCVVLLTGTDVNQGLDDPAQRKVIRTVLDRSAAILVHNPLIAANFSANHPELSSNLRVLSPGIALGTEPYDLRTRHTLPSDVTLFLCPAGLRPVKGLLELLEMFDPFPAQYAAFILAFCGPALDAGYSGLMLEAIKRRDWARYLGTIPPQAMASAMRGADVIVNNSHSEGLSNTLLEAAAIGVPMLARRIPGNASVVSHNRNGLLYDNGTELLRYALQLTNPARRRQLVCPDPERYNPNRELTELSAILQHAARKGCDH